jgi:hypothetical protein
LARLQGKGKDAGYVDHLNWVHPFWLERVFASLELEVENLAVDKLQRVARGEGLALHYGAMQRTLQLLSKVGVASMFVELLIAMRLFPSMIYLVRKPS